MQITELAVLFSIVCLFNNFHLIVVFFVHLCSYSDSCWCCYCLDRSQTNLYNN